MRECKKGYNCGKTCIERKDDCDELTSLQSGKIMDNYEAIFRLFDDKAEVLVPGGNIGERMFKYDKGKIAKAKAESGEWSEEQTTKFLEDAWLAVNASYTPVQAQAVLAREIDLDSGHELVTKLGRKPTFEEYGDWMSKQEWYKNPNLGSKAQNGKERIEGDRRLYELPGMKQKNSIFASKADENEAIEKIWSAMPADIRESLFKSSAGEPNRDDPPNRVQEDWGGDLESMRKGMLRTLLQQAVRDKDGQIYFADPKSPDGRLGVPPALDHIIPLARGGTHTEENWTFTSDVSNSTVKGNGTLVDEVKKLKAAAKGKGKKTAEEIYRQKRDKGIKDILDTVMEEEITESIDKAARAMMQRAEAELADTIESAGNNNNYPGIKEAYMKMQAGGTNAGLRGAFMRGLERAEVVPPGFGAQFRDYTDPAQQDKYALEFLTELEEKPKHGLSLAAKVLQDYQKPKSAFTPRAQKRYKVIPDYETYKAKPEALGIGLLKALNTGKADPTQPMNTLTPAIWEEKVFPGINSAFPIAAMPPEIKRIFPRTGDAYTALSLENRKKINQFLNERGLIASFDDLSPELQALVKPKKG